MATVVRMPAALAGVTEGIIQTWLTQPGQRIAAGEPLAEIETEKAVVEFAAETDGTVGRLLAEPGHTLPVGEPIAVILADGEDESTIESALATAGADPGADAGGPSEPATEHADVAAPSASATNGQGPGRLFATPLVRRLARERGIDLTTIRGTGPGGRIVRRDVDSLVAAATTVSDQPSAAAANSLQADESTTYTDVPLSGMRRAIARRLTESKTTVPHFYVVADCQVDRLLELRTEVNAVAERKVSVNDFVLKAVAGAHTAVPAANRTWNGDAIRRYDNVDIAVAVAVEDGLVTPVVRGADRLGITAISERVADVVERAHAGQLQQHELEGGSVAVSNLGMYGVQEFSAILNPPQSGILAVGAAKPRPIVVDGELAVGTVMTVTFSADHRVIDGVVAAAWMAAFVGLIEQPIRLLV